MEDLKNKTFIGIVEDNKDPRKIGRCRIRVVNIFDDIPTEDIPWASPWKDISGSAFSVPEISKIVTVVFDQGNLYKPEYICAEHYNVNLEEKLKGLSQKTDEDGRSPYNTMKVLMFDHYTQIYSNKLEGLRIDHDYNNINIKNESISLNLKDKKGSLNLGDEKADQQVILGNHFLDWFEDLLQILLFKSFIGTQPGAPLPPRPELIDHIFKYYELRDQQFLSKHVRVIDNEQIETASNTDNSFPVHRVNIGQLGDAWRAFNNIVGGISAGYSQINNLVKFIKQAPRPWKKKKKRFDAKYKSPQEKNPVDGPGSTNQNDTPQSAPPTQNVGNPDNSKPADGIGNTYNSPATSQDFTNVNPQVEIEYYEEEDEIFKLIRYMESKTGSSPVTGKSEDYVVYDDPWVMNIVAFRNRKHEYGTVTNRFDDQLWVFYKSEKNQWETIRKYSVTTVPGHKVVDGKKVDPPVLPENVGFINYGQYINSYKLGFHNTDDYGKRHPALICDKVGIRMNKSKGRYVKDRYVNTVLSTQLGINIDGWVYGTGMNIHCAISMDEAVYDDAKHPEANMIYDEVNNWSAGCIVFNNPAQYREFIGLCNEQKTKAKKSQFTLTVASFREYELFESDLFVEDESNETLSDDILDRFPDFNETDDLDY